MNLAGKKVLVTGANRGIGRALVTTLLERGAARVFAGSRSGRALDGVGAEDRERVVPIALDVTVPANIADLPRSIEDVALVINNAGTLASFSALGDPLTHIRRDMDTNFFGPLLVSRALAPLLERHHDAAIVNVLSVVALASMPGLGGYSASKAAAYSLTQALRGELRPRKIRVVAVFPGPVDTDMIRSFAIAKTPAAAVARAIVEGLERGEDDIAPDPMSRDVLARWRTDPKAIEERFGGM